MLPVESEANVVALMPWDRAIRRAKQRRRALDVLTDQEDADRAIRALSEVETYYAVKEIGPEDATPILALLQPEQIRAVLDLDVWHRGELDRADLLFWLELFREAGLDALHRAARALDPETLAALFARRLLIALKPKEDASDPEEVPAWVIDPPVEIEPLAETTDGRFIIAARADDQGDPLDEEERKLILRLVEDLYRDEDWERIASILRMAMSDSVIELEEDALRVRDGRLEDLGFPPFARALEVYAPLDPSALGRELPRYPRTEMQLPALHAAELGSGFFHQVMEAIDDHEHVLRIEGDLVPLANEILVADGAEPGALEAMRTSLLAMRGYLEIALGDGHEEGDVAGAAARAVRVPMRTLFRVGYGLTLRLGTRARSLLEEARLVEMLGDGDRALLAALTRKRPRAPGVEDVVPLDDRTYRQAVRALDDLEGLVEVYRRFDLGALREEGALEPPELERTLDMWITTGAARALLGGAFVFQPLDAGALADLADLLPARDGRFDADRVIAVLPELSDRAKSALVRRIRTGLDALAETLWPLVGSSEIDVRFVGGVVRRLA